MTEGISYKKCTYNEEERKMWEKDCRIYRIRQERIKKLAEEKTEENLWQTIVAFQEYPFKTMTGLPFYYKLKIGKNGEWNKELLIDRREKSKSLAWSRPSCLSKMSVGPLKPFSAMRASTMTSMEGRPAW